MKQFIVAFLIFLVWAVFGFWLYTSVGTSQNDDILAAQEVIAQQEEPTMSQNMIDSLHSDTLQNVPEVELPASSKDFKAVTAQGDVIFMFDEGITIVKNTSDLIFSPSSIDFKYKLNTYLIEHPDQELHILSYYDPSENFEAPNLGEQRGLKMATLLQQTGILKERMVIKPTIKKMDFDSLGQFPNGIGFVLRPLDEDRLKLPATMIPPPKSIYPTFVNNDVFANDELKDLVSEMQGILPANPSVMVEIIGHTDNIGNAQDNYLLGKKYAQQVRWYLINKGKFDKNRIQALSKGELEPIADNKFKAGRIQNKRIEIKYVLK